MEGSGRGWNFPNMHTGQIRIGCVFEVNRSILSCIYGGGKNKGQKRTRGKYARACVFEVNYGVLPCIYDCGKNKSQIRTQGKYAYVCVFEINDSVLTCICGGLLFQLNKSYPMQIFHVGLFQFYQVGMKTFGNQ